MDHSPRTATDPCDMTELAEALAKAVALAREQAASTAHYKKMYDRSSLLAKIGVWECELATNALTWTDGVYDLFELPRGSVLNRAETAAMYDSETGQEMERLRAQAIATGDGFTMDARIRTAQGNIRWMRLTADIEQENGVPVRIFGAKQDITAEKAVWHRLQALAERDPLTGLANRGVFDAVIAADREEMAIGALLLVDLDGFKRINDTFGHAAGDECLKVSAKRLKLSFPQARLVARIGGDEFAVLLGRAADREQVEDGARDLLAAFRQPMVWHDQRLQVSASIGVAITDPDDTEALFAHADAALYESKGAGRSTFRVFSGMVWKLPSYEPAEARSVG